MWLGAASPSARAADAAAKTLASQVLQAAGVRGGLIVHVGCGDGKLTAALRASDSYLVHGLGAGAADVAKAREHIRSLGLYGKVSVDRFGGKRLPYTDNLVNLVVSEDLGKVPMDEVMRVLSPNGVAYIMKGDGWTRTVKPRPEEIDEWTHYLYDATNNAVSRDSVVAPPHHMQWVGDPAWARSHDHLASVSAAVAAGGRIFYIADEGLPATVALEPKWRLVARDAFSGVLLWKRPIAKWQYHLRGFRSGPAELPRRLVAVGDRVYVTLGLGEPLRALDAATGKILATYKGTEGTLEFVCHEGRLFVVAGSGAGREAAAKAGRRGQRPGFVAASPQRPEYREKPPLKRLVAIDAETGRTLWSKADADTAELMPTTLAVSGGRAFFQSPDEVMCLNAASGRDLWRSKRPVSHSRPSWTAPTLVVYGDVVLSGDRAVAERKTQDPNDPRKVEWVVTSAGGRAPVGELIAFLAKDGKRLWSGKCKECYNAPVDVLVADGLVWTGYLVSAREPGITQGLDPKTGEVKRTRPKDQTFFACGMGHHRCHRNRGAGRYLVLGRSGVEFIDLATGSGIPNHWVRGGCQYGVIPCNGLLYAPSHSCACFTTAKLNGFNCLAPKRASEPAAAPDEARLQRGGAYGEAGPGKRPAPRTDEWPTYRHDPARSGRTTSNVPAELARSWETDLGGKLSSVVVAEGRLFVSQIDVHDVVALDAGDGRRLWAYTAGGRVDSPPSIWQGRVLFGCSDGWVYCLRASDGELIWRFRAAPQDRRVVAYGQLESAWPVPGNVLVRDGIVYCAAGRSSYLDGGIRLYRLDAKTGRKLSERCIDHRDPKTGYQLKGATRGTNIPGALPDVLSCDGESVYLRHLRFDLSGQPLKGEVPHLFSAAGFLDGAWWHRTYWQVGTAMGTNYGGWPRAGNQVPAGRILAIDDSTVYGFGRNLYINHGAHVGIDGATIFHFRPPREDSRRFTYYRAFAAERRAPSGAGEQPGKPGAKRRRAPARRARTFRWTQKLPIMARAMVLTPKLLLLAGPPDILACDDPIGALEGRKGGTLIALAPSDGKKLAEYPLKAPPAWDAMAAAYGRLYVATMDGRVVCLAGQKQ